MKGLVRSASTVSKWPSFEVQACPVCGGEVFRPANDFPAERFPVFRGPDGGLKKPHYAPSGLVPLGEPFVCIHCDDKDERVSRAVSRVGYDPMTGEEIVLEIEVEATRWRIKATKP